MVWEANPLVPPFWVSFFLSIPPFQQVMGLSRDRTESALKGCVELSKFRRGALRSFLSTLSDDALMAMRMEDGADDDEIVGFLDMEERSGKMILRASAR